MRQRFQVALNHALARYLHGANLTRAGRVLFPLVDAARPGPLGELREAARPLGVRLPADAPAAIAASFRALDDLLGKETPDGDFAEREIAAWDDLRHGRVPALRKARAHLRGAARATGVEFFVHGSCATLDYTRYSDLDTLVLVPRHVATDANTLRGCRDALVRTWRAIKEFDPLQHHGHFVLTEVDLRGYPEPLFPAVIFDRTITVTRRRRILRLRALPAPDLARERFESVATRYLATRLERGLDNAYRLKSDLSVFMLLPALYAQAHGRPVAKHASFGPVYRLLSPGAVTTFRRAAMIRQIWDYDEPPLNRWLRRLWINPLLPAAVDAARARPPVESVRRLADPVFFAATKAAVRELLNLHAGQRPVARESVA